MLPPAWLPMDNIPIQQVSELMVGVHRILTSRNASPEEQQVEKIASPWPATIAASKTYPHVAVQKNQVLPQAPPSPAAVVSQETNPPVEMLPKISLEEPPPGLQSTPDHAPSQRPSVTPSPPYPVLTPISVHSTNTSEQNWETSPQAMNLSPAAVIPAVISVADVNLSACHESCCCESCVHWPVNPKLLPRLPDEAGLPRTCPSPGPRVPIPLCPPD